MTYTHWEDDITSTETSQHITPHEPIGIHRATIEDTITRNLSPDKTIDTDTNIVSKPPTLFYHLIHTCVWYLIFDTANNTFPITSTGWDPPPANPHPPTKAT